MIDQNVINKWMATLCGIMGMDPDSLASYSLHSDLETFVIDNGAWNEACVWWATEFIQDSFYDDRDSESITPDHKKRLDEALAGIAKLQGDMKEAGSVSPWNG